MIMNFKTFLSEDLISDLQEANKILLKYKKALEKISKIEDKMHGNDWEEINEARDIADAALKK
jgi:hypothetical protein